MIGDARYDDLRGDGWGLSLGFSDPEETLVADVPARVGDAIQRAAAAVERGRWVVGYVAYEAAAAFGLAVSPLRGTWCEGLPLAQFFVYPGPQGGAPGGPYRLGEWTSSVDYETYRRAVEEIGRRILMGDTYQVNYTFRMHAPFRGDALGFYHDLIGSQWCGYGAFIDLGRWVVVSASPELFFEWDGRRVRSRPMKGTAGRGLIRTDDELRGRELAESEKDRAENLMIVDMVRNDLGRIARVGSVAATELFRVEKYDTVWQLTSTIEAETKPATELVELFEAAFPGASVTGAPKHETMEIISRLETGPRGVYCGAVGLGVPAAAAGGGGRWVFNLAIRTALVDREAGVVGYGTGGGITHYSTAADEWAESLLKTRVVERRGGEFQLLETIRYRDGVWRLLERHLRRLADSADYFGVPLDLDEVEKRLARTGMGEPADGVVRVLVDRRGNIGLEVTTPPAPGELPVRLAVDDVPVDLSDPFLYHKTTRRHHLEAARRRHRWANDVVLVNPRGEVCETTIGNLVVRLDDRWYTPPIESGCLPGVERAELLERGVITERVVTLKDLASASEVARINSVRGWEPAVVVHHRRPTRR